MNTEAPAIKRLDTVPTVTLIIQNTNGIPQGFLSGEAKGLANWLEVAAAEQGPVKLGASNFVTPGQAVYEVEREFFLAVRGGLTFLTWQAILDLENTIPSEAKLFLVVSY